MHRGEIVQGEYGTTLVSGPPDRPEPPRADPKADNMTEEQVLVRAGWTRAQLHEALAVGFPKSRPTWKLVFGKVPRVVAMWSRRDVERWRDTVIALVGGR